jgi:hypothetical protein
VSIPESRSIRRFGVSIKERRPYGEFVAMLEVEILGNKPAIDAARTELASLSQEGIRQYMHRGFAGEAGVFGLIGKILPASLPAFFNLLKSLLVKDRDLKVTFDGYEFVVRDISELEKLLDMLSARGVVVHKGQA